MNITSIEKSNNDKREYTYFTLDNKLQCLIIKDNDESMCGACLNIEVGSMLETVDGLAHFLEHMVFMGSKKYPQSNDFMGSINKSGGETNASTSNTFTNYYFTISPDKYLETLDKFSQFFIDPLLNQVYIDKEINAVNSESMKNVLDDNWISQEILRTLVNNIYPLNHYTCGTTKSLTIPNIYDKLLEFHNKYYLAQYMTLVIFINKDINMNDLTSQILNTFGIIKHTNEIITKKYGRILKSQQIVYYVPNKNENKLSIVFEFKKQKELLKAPYWFLKQIFSSQYKKSLYDHLLKKNYVMQSDINDIISLDDYDIFTVDFILTENGINNVQEIYSYVINYLKYIVNKINNKDEYLKKIYNEYLQTNKNNFKYWEDIDIIDTMTLMSHIMQEELPKEFLLSFDTHLYDFDEFCNFAKFILEDYNFSVSIGSKKYKDICTEKFPIYDVCYKVEDLKLLDINIESLPIINDFVCYNLEFDKQIQQLKLPMQIDKYKDKYNLFYYGDINFNIPNIDIKIIIKLPTILNNARTYVGMLLFLNSAYSHINPYKNMAADANYLINVRLEYDLLYIYISGYTQKIKKIIRVIKKMFLKDFKEKHYKIAHYQLIKSLKNINVSSPLTQMNILFEKNIYPKYFMPNEQLKEAENITMSECIEIFRNNFIKARTNILCSGNINSETAEYLSTKLYESLGIKENINDQNIFNINMDLINYNTPYIKIIKSSNNEEKNNIMTYNYNLFTFRKIGKKWESKILFARLCASLLSYKYFYSLRTEKQLGYIVRCKIVTVINNFNITCILQFTVQSPNTKTDKLIKLTDEFLKEQSNYIMNIMTEQEYKLYIKGERTKLQKKFTSLTSLNIYYTSALLDESFTFDLNTRLLNKLEYFNINKFRKYYNKYIMNNNNILILGIDSK
jgi:insulysin